MKKAIVFPYSNSCCEILRYRDMIPEYEIVGAVAPGGMGIKDRDAGFVDGGTDIGIKVTTEVDYDSGFDAFIIMSDMDNEYIIRATEYYIREGLDNEKNFIFLSKPNEQIMSIFNGKENRMLDLSDDWLNTKYVEKLYKIETPVIAVAGVAELTQKFKIQLEINKYMKERGYKVSHVCSKAYGKLFGIHPFPNIMFGKEKEQDKIYYFNNYLRYIEKMEQPDVIIIGIPGGVMPYNEMFPGYFGITFHETMQAVKPDVLIMGCLFEKYTDEYFENLSRGIRYKSGVEIDAFNISTFQIDINESEQTKKMQYYKVSHSDADEIVCSCKKHALFNVMNGPVGRRMAELAERKLLEYAETQAI